MLQDVKQALRTFRSAPGVGITALVTLAIGIGANTAIFSVISAALLRPLPFPEPARLIQVSGIALLRTLAESTQDVVAWKDHVHSLESVAAYQAGEVNLAGISGWPERLSVAEVTPDFWRALRMNPVLGRPLAGPHEVVLSWNLWKRHFAADPAVLGKSLTVDGLPATIVGVMPAGFRFPQEAELWIPWGTAGATLHKGISIADTIARIRPDLSLEQAQAEMDAITARVLRQHPEWAKPAGWVQTGAEPIRLRELQAGLARDSRPALLLLAGAVGFVLLIACANVANLLLARAAERRREFAVRSALGAGQARLLRQLLTESLVLALLAGAAGLLLAAWGVDLLLRFVPVDVPRLNHIGIDGWVLLFTTAISLLVGILFGLAPALGLSRTDLTGFLKDGGARAGSRRSRVRGALVIAEIALSLVLVAGAGLMVRTVIGLLAVNPGFDPAHVLTFAVSLSGPQYETRGESVVSPPPRVAAWYDDVLRRLEALPGVQSAGAVNYLPLDEGPSIGLLIQTEGQPAPTLSVADMSKFAGYRVVTPHYFRALGIPLLAGRAFTVQDNAKSPKVAVVNETFARHYWPGKNPLGRRFSALMGEWYEVVGVVGDVHHNGLDLSAQAECYLPQAQRDSPFMTVVVRTAGRPQDLAAAVRAEVFSVDQNQPVSSLRTMQEIVSASLGSRRSYMVLLGIFGLLAVLLAAVGVYGVVGYTVIERTHEIGVRVALGATRAEVFRLVLHQGFLLAAAGISLGIAGALMLTRFLKTFLFGVAPSDPWTLAAAGSLFLLVVGLASFVPARRATRVDPVIALRCE